MVGGPVRDAMLGAPVLDLDFSVEGDAVGLGRRLERLIGGRCTTHQRFGTATVDTGYVRIDLVTARRESYPRPGQLPEVTFAGIYDDLARRDFTINAMALPVTGEVTGVLDPFGGVDDLESGTIKIQHPASFNDDPTRMFRAVRYEQRFGFGIDDESVGCLASAILGGHMHAVSGDRWRHEIDRTMDEADPGPPLLRASDLGILAGLHPALENDEGLRGLAAWAGIPPAREEWLVALIAPLNALEGEEVIDRLRLTGRQAVLARDTIEAKWEESSIDLASQRPSDLYRRLSVFDPSVVSFHAKLDSDSTMSRAFRFYLDELRPIRTDISGDELLGMGAAQGPVIGQILLQLRDAKLDGKISTIEEERALARALLACER